MYTKYVSLSNNITFMLLNSIMDMPASPPASCYYTYIALYRPWEHTSKQYNSNNYFPYIIFQYNIERQLDHYGNAGGLWKHCNVSFSSSGLLERMRLEAAPKIIVITTERCLRITWFISSQHALFEQRNMWIFYLKNAVSSQLKSHQSWTPELSTCISANLP